MSDADPQRPSSAPPLDYARRLPEDVRTSRLAIGSFFIAILGSPCIWGPFSDWINWYVPQDFNQVGRYGYLHQWLIFGAMMLATALPVAAILRISFSQGRRVGIRLAIMALAISLFWWTCTGVGSLMMMGLGPH